MIAEIIHLVDRRPPAAPEERPTWPQVRWLRAAGRNDQLPTHSDDGRCLANAKTMRACEWRGWARRTTVEVPTEINGCAFMCSQDRWFITAAGREIAKTEVKR